jgi:DNA-nicking Smr family endonuclease
MAKQRKTPARDNGRDVRESVPKPIFASPFKDLGKLLRQRQLEKPQVPASKPVAQALPDPAASTGLDDQALLRQALDGVRQLNADRPFRMPVEPTVARAIVSEDAEVLARLSDLVAGRAPFDITETDEYVEGMRVDLDPRLVVRLRRGEFPIQAHVDLHGMIQSAAKETLTSFVLESARKGFRTILVVHGKGLRSPGGHPVLKHAIAQWLSRGTLCGYVLAFTTARPADGGGGAMYVLLKREHKRAPFDVLTGAKRNA